MVVVLHVAAPSPPSVVQCTLSLQVVRHAVLPLLHWYAPQLNDAPAALQLPAPSHLRGGIAVAAVVALPGVHDPVTQLSATLGN